MKYELVTWNYNGIQIDNGNDTTTYSIIVTAGIVGDTYGFIAPDLTKNMFKVIVPNKQKDIEQIEAQIETESIAYVAATYPNT